MASLMRWLASHSRRRHCIRRLLPLLCFVPLAVYMLRIFLTRPPKQLPRETFDRQLLEEIKSFTEHEVKWNTSQLDADRNATAAAAAAHATRACAPLHKQQQQAMVECPPRAGVYPYDCWRRGCCWMPAQNKSAARPSCVMPPSYQRYHIYDREVMKTTSRLTLNRKATGTLAPGESNSVTVDISRVTYDTVRIRIWDFSRQEFIPPVPVLAEEERDAFEASGYAAKISDKEVLSIQAKQSGRVLVNFDLPRLYYAQREKQVTLFPGASLAYGVRRAPAGQPFLDMRGEPSRHLFYHGGGFSKASRTSGTYPADHPFLILVSPENGSACGVYLHNGNQIELMTSPPGAMTFRTNGGQLDFYVFAGPTPKAAMEQYQKLVGRPSLPFVKTLLHPMRTSGPVPLAKLATNTMFARAVNRLAILKHKHNTNVSITSKVVIQDSTGDQPYTCYDKMDKAVYIMDFTHPHARRYWDETLFLCSLSVVTNDTLDYLLLEEPRCLRPGSVTPECPKEPPGGAAYGAICGAARLHLSTYANLRNAYPYLLAEMTHRYRAKETLLRQRLLSDATFSGQGKWSGFWRARAPAYWVQLKDTLAEMLTFGMLGVNLYGARACNLAKVRDERDAELCLRWFSLSVFFPVHQDLGKPTSAIQRRVAMQGLRATTLRRFLVPYAYTTLVKVSHGGGMLARPTYFEFPGDPKTHHYPNQFMFGPGLLVAPQLDKGVTLVEVYFPRGRWYDWYNSRRIESTGQAMFVPSPNATAAIFTRGGTIIPGGALNRSTNDIHIIVSPDNTEYAYGELISDDGMFTGTFVTGSYSLIHFSYMKGMLTGHCSICKWGATLRAATVFGVPGPAPARVLLNDRPLKFAFVNTTLYIFDIGHKLRKPFAIILSRLG